MRVSAGLDPEFSRPLRLLADGAAELTLKTNALLEIMGE